jgi:hypothetical protein
MILSQLFQVRRFRIKNLRREGDLYTKHTSFLRVLLQAWEMNPFKASKRKI